jgi:hypothetical protein
MTHDSFIREAIRQLKKLGLLRNSYTPDTSNWLELSVTTGGPIQINYRNYATASESLGAHRWLLGKGRRVKVSISKKRPWVLWHLQLQKFLCGPSLPTSIKIGFLLGGIAVAAHWFLLSLISIHTSNVSGCKRICPQLKKRMFACESLATSLSFRSYAVFWCKI